VAKFPPAKAKKAVASEESSDDETVKVIQKLKNHKYFKMIY
jgi:hypothetical protein